MEPFGKHFVVVRVRMDIPWAVELLTPPKSFSYFGLCGHLEALAGMAQE